MYVAVPPKFSELLDNEEIQAGIQDSGHFTGDTFSVSTTERKDTKSTDELTSNGDEDYNFNGQEKTRNGDLGVKVNGAKESHVNGGIVLKMNGEKSENCDDDSSKSDDDNVDEANGSNSDNINNHDSGDGTEENGIEKPNESVDSVVSSENTNDNMQSSTTSSTRTITCEQEIDSEIRNLDLKTDDQNQLIKTDENSVSEPTTPVKSRFKGHRRTHSSDGSPMKAVVKTASYTEGVSSSAYYGKGATKKPASLNCLDNLGLIHRFLSSDGLLKPDDILQCRLQQIDAEHRVEIRKLHKRIELECQARLAIASKKDEDQLGTSPGRSSDGADEMVNVLLNKLFFGPFLAFCIIFKRMLSYMLLFTSAGPTVKRGGNFYFKTRG